MAMIRLSAFADEISPELDEQIATLQREGIRYLDLRSTWNINVLDLSDAQISQVKQTLDAHSIGVAAIGSPIGKTAIDSPFDTTMQQLTRAISVAQALGTPFIRIFSFYPPAHAQGASASIDAHRDEVMRRLHVIIERARSANMILLHENEKDIYGDTIARCVDLMQSCEDEHFRVVFDPANFIQCTQIPYPDAYEALRPWLAYVHVKDALPNGNVVAAGEGAARWPDLLQRLRADGYNGFLTLEPHLASAGQFQGFSGPALFGKASQALQGMLREMGWEYE
ncbi:MAG TPA: sugar phosphate isomerase/epimerase family protein [Ktedonobacteraceae bacterium]|nr:sugar phosphate isomerase/epimerase family protein [Ktedonobacteraceae bacterium]